MKLSHVLLMSFLTGGIGLLVGARASQHGALFWLFIPIALFVALLMAWPISRLLRLSPLMIFAGPCPACRTSPPGWWAKEAGSRRFVLTCGTCG
jgi:hypothetical protein